MDAHIRSLLLISSFFITITVVGAVTHQITWEAGFDGTNWASNQTFSVGDKLIFFSAEQNNVMNVTHVDYKTCNPSSPYATYRTGNNMVTVDRNDLYFISGVQEYCRSGLKLHVQTSPVSTSTPSNRASSVAVASRRLFCFVLSCIRVLYM